MASLFTLLLVVHATAGAIALLAGSLNMVRKKGTAPHVKVGLIYFYAVLVNALCAFCMAVLHPNVFLFCLGVLSSYLAIKGRRALWRAKTQGRVAAGPLDRFLDLALLCFGVLLLVFSGWALVGGTSNFIPMVFAVAFIYLAGRSILRQWKPLPASNEGYLKAHIGYMIGSYTTILSAFLVVNDHDHYPLLLGWFGPSVIFMPLIGLWQKKYPTWASLER